MVHVFASYLALKFSNFLTNLFNVSLKIDWINMSSFEHSIQTKVINSIPFFMLGIANDDDGKYVYVHHPFEILVAY